MTSTQIASDLSFEVHQLRARRFELATPQLDSRNERLVSLPGVIERHAFIADRTLAVSEDVWRARLIARRLER